MWTDHNYSVLFYFLYIFFFPSKGLLQIQIDNCSLLSCNLLLHDFSFWVLGSLSKWLFHEVLKFHLCCCSDFSSWFPQFKWTEVSLCCCDCCFFFLGGCSWFYVLYFSGAPLIVFKYFMSRHYWSWFWSWSVVSWAGHKMVTTSTLITQLNGVRGGG